MVTVYDVEPNLFIEELAKELEKEIQMPEWAKFVKTGHGRERPPLQDNWWYLRAAAILRQIYIHGPIGVSRLRTRFGNRKNRGHAPEKHAKASGKIIRTILQQLEEKGYIKHVEIKKGKNVYKGRVVTEKGKSFLDKLAAKIKASSQ